MKAGAAAAAAAARPGWRPGTCGTWPFRAFSYFSAFCGPDLLQTNKPLAWHGRSLPTSSSLCAGFPCSGHHPHTHKQSRLAASSPLQPLCKEGGGGGGWWLRQYQAARQVI